HAMENWSAICNDNLRPFRRVRAADEIFALMMRYLEPLVGNELVIRALVVLDATVSVDDGNPASVVDRAVQQRSRYRYPAQCFVEIVASTLSNGSEVRSLTRHHGGVCLRITR
ncbi:MAG: hypothetical protein ACYDED_06300, partial [Ferrimicrobium sp.]